MRQAAYLSGYGRGAFGVVAAACLGLTLAGCSSGVSRFDFPAFNLTSNDTACGRRQRRSRLDLVTAAGASGGVGVQLGRGRAAAPHPRQPAAAGLYAAPGRLLARAERTRRRRHRQLRGASRAAARACRAAPQGPGRSRQGREGRHALHPVAPLRRSGREDHGGQQSARRAPLDRPGADHPRRERAQGGGRGCSRRGCAAGSGSIDLQGRRRATPRMASPTSSASARRR